MTVTLTKTEIQLLVSVLEQKADKLKELNLQDKSRIANMERLASFLESHL